MMKPHWNFSTTYEGVIKYFERLALPGIGEEYGLLVIRHAIPPISPLFACCLNTAYHIF
jgi:hypothetical protein